MTTENADPSLDPANNDNLPGLFRHVFAKLMQGVNVALPMQVIAASRTPQPRVQLQPLIAVTTTAGQTKPRGQVASAPVMQMGGNGVFLSFNLVAGDEGLLIASDRDISLYLQAGAQAPPNTLRTHDFADGFFIPFIMRGYTIVGEDRSNAVLQNLNGSLRIAMWPDKIKFTGAVEFAGPVTMDETLTVTGRIVGEADIASGANMTATGNFIPGTPP